MLQIALILQPIVDASEAILKFWEGLTHSWGVAIILLTFTIRLAILPLTFSSVKSMQKLQVLQPEIKKIQERYKGDKQRVNQEMMKFYQERSVNPLASCLPLLLQIPFFISLFYLLRSAAFKEDIGGSEPFLFIPDLAQPLTGHPAILALMIVLYIGTQLIASMITSIGGDKNQQRIMMALPFVFTIFIINFPAGLLVYWITTNVWTIGQQLAVRKLYPKPDMAALADEGDGGGGAARGKPKPEPPPPKDDADGKAPRARKKPQRAAKEAESSNGGAPKAPPGSPRKKKKRSGRRR
jgi:YidC/Oxa1 family membrane protein insertase